METRVDVIDFHAHVLPCADHGSDSVETSLWQLDQARLNGVSRVIATPHFYPTSHSLDHFLERRNRAYKELLKKKSDDFPEIKLGAEVLACNGIENLDGLEQLCIEGTRCLLLELPFSDFSEDYPLCVTKLRSKGYEVVLAHAERYNPENVNAMVDAGALIQLNAEALCGLFINSSVKNWIQDGTVVALGSDIHMRDRTAYKKMRKAISRFPSLRSSVIEFCEKIWNK